MATPITLDELAELCKERKMTYAEARDYLDGVRTPPPRPIPLTEVADAELDWLEKQARSDYGLTRSEQQRVIFSLRSAREEIKTLSRLLDATDADKNTYQERIWLLRRAVQATLLPSRTLDEIRNIAANALAYDNVKDYKMGVGKNETPEEHAESLRRRQAFLETADQTVTAQRP